MLPVFREIRFRIIVASISGSSACYEALSASPGGGLGTRVLPIAFKGGEAMGARL